MAGWKGFGITTGWSAVGGQTQTPYVVGGVAPGEKLLGHSVCARFAVARRLAHNDFRLPLARPLEVL